MSEAPTVTLKEAVFEALNNARDNGYDDMFGGSPEDIAIDLLMYDEQCFVLTGGDDELMDVEEQIEQCKPHIVAWIAEQQAKVH